MGSAATRLKRWKDRFYRGPRNMGALKVPRFVGYQSFTLTALYWCSYFINTQLTLIGRIMILIGTMMISYCLLDPYTFPMSYLSFSLICLYMVNIIIGFIFKPSVKVTRHIPDKVICGTTVPISYSVENTGSLPCFDLKFDAINYPGTNKESVISIASLPSGENLRESSTMQFTHRGRFYLPQVFVESSFPFGLWKWGKFGDGTREIKVMPDPISIAGLQLPFLAGENDIDVLQSSEGSGMEFASCREFRFGDNPRHIHWASWARTTVPIVREMTNEGRPAVSVLFDPCYEVNLITKYQDIQANFELAVSFLAGICQHTSNQNYCIRNFIVGKEINQYKGNKPKEIYEEILSKCTDIVDIRSIKPLTMSDFTYEKINETKGLLVILQNYDKTRQELIKKLEESGIPVKVFLLGKEEPEVHGNYTFISYSNLEKGALGQL